MKAAIAGLGWVTPLGSDLAQVWQALRSGAVAETRPLENPETGRVLASRPVPPKLVEHLARHPRMRRSSPISYFAVAAAQAALADAGLTDPQGTAIVFAVSDGSVVYTRRFYDQVVKQGANAASPMLFPETVYNAPASHLAAMLGLDGATYTLVGDNTVGLTALHFGAQLLTMGEAERVLVVGCEEIDWILCEAYHDWRLTSTPLAEGAGAVLLQSAGGLGLETTAGVPFARRRDAASALQSAVATLPVGADLIVSSAANLFAERAEAVAIPGVEPRRIYPKRQLGEAPGASALWQIICAALALHQGEAHAALVPAVGFNQQAAAAYLLPGA